MKPSETGIVHLWDLPERSVCLKLNCLYSDEMLNLGKKVAGGKWNDLARMLNIHISKDNGFSAIRQMRRIGIVRLDVLKKLSSFLVSSGYPKFSLEKIEGDLLLSKI